MVSQSFYIRYAVKGPLPSLASCLPHVHNNAATPQNGLNSNAQKLDNALIERILYSPKTRTGIAEVNRRKENVSLE